MALVSVLSEILGKPRILDVVFELMVFITPFWIAIIVGVLVGWSWKPKWVNLGIGRDINLSDSSSVSNDSKSSSTSFSFLGSMPSFNSFNFQIANSLFTTSFDGKVQKEDSSSSNSGSSLVELEEKSELLNENDLEYIYKLVEEKDGGPTWIQMMDRSTSTMSYQAWRRDPETGPPQYRSRTVYENATPEMLRDFFWDDDFRLKWEDMLISATTLAECPTTGTMVVHWVRKFPFFCSDREYIIGRRIWEAGRSYYCVTKSVPCSSVPRRNKPRRVDLYYSSWCIRAVESKNGGEQLSACEVTLFHYENMGIPWEIAKLGVRQGMWGAVKRIDPGLRAYQKERALGATLSRCAFMAQINNKVNVDYLRCLENSTRISSEDGSSSSPEKPAGKNIPKLLVVGGAIVLACSIDHGLLTKAVIFGIARRFAKIGRRL